MLPYRALDLCGPTSSKPMASEAVMTSRRTVFRGLGFRGLGFVSSCGMRVTWE